MMSQLPQLTGFQRVHSICCMPVGHTLSFAQSNLSGAASVIIWSGVLLALIIIAFFAYTQFKRWMTDAEPSSSGPGFTLSDLRELHRQGKMTTEEFEMAKAKMVASAKKMAEAMPDPLAGRRKPANSPGSDPPRTADS